MRYLMIDRILGFQKNCSATAVKNITLSDDVFTDHFPELPIYPGAFLIESAAQLGGFLVEMSLNTSPQVRRAMLVQVNQAKFHRPAEPGDQLLLGAELDNVGDDAAQVKVTIACAGEKIARVHLTFVLKEVPHEMIHEQRRSLYRIWTKNLAGIPEIL